MKKSKEESMYVVTLVPQFTKEDKEQLDIMFNKLTDYKNEFVIFIRNKINKMVMEDPELSKIQKRIDELHAEGKVSRENEKKKELRDLYKERRSIIYAQEKARREEFKKEKKRQEKLKEEGLIDKIVMPKIDMLTQYSLVPQFRPTVSKDYNIYLHDDSKSYGEAAVVKGLDKWLTGEGKMIHTKKYTQTSAIESKINIRDNGTRNSSFIQFFFEGDNLFIKLFDLSEENVKQAKEQIAAGKNVTHKFKMIPVRINWKDEYQKEVFKTVRYGESKIMRYWKGHEYKYRIQLSIKDFSPKVKTMKNEKYPVAIDLGTETVAVVRLDGAQYIEEISPDTVGIDDMVADLNRYLDNSLRAMNPLLYREDGTRISKKEAEDLELPAQQFSKRYLRGQAEKKTLQGKSARRKKKNNENTARRIFEWGNEFFIEDNNVKAWQMKRVRMAPIAKEKHDNGVRKNDYTKQVHDRAVGQIPARVKVLCNSTKKPFHKIGIVRLSDGDPEFTVKLSSYNHFSKQNDVFEQLNERVVTLDGSRITEDGRVVGFSETFATIKNDKGEDITLQCDLYAASKMLFCYAKEEKKVSQTGKEYMAEVWYFNQEAYAKWFDEIFYPVHKIYVEKLKEMRSLGMKLSGTILGY